MPDLPNFIHCRQRAAISFSGAIADEVQGWDCSDVRLLGEIRMDSAIRDTVT
jgi:hypothetical protein